VRSRQHIPLRELWGGFLPRYSKGYYVVLRGYIDESYGPNQNVFAWSCLMGRPAHWWEMERKWKLRLNAKNRELKKAGRPSISRYHASDCSGRRNEFDGWSHDERDAFVLGLFGIFKQTPLHASVFDMQLDELIDVFPEWSEDRLGAAYHWLTTFQMYMIGQDFKKLMPHGVVTLFHDQTAGNGRYDPVILRAFNQQMNKPDFMHKEHFTTIAPMRWEQCRALQPADLVAFECFKDAEGRLEARESRKSFKALLSMKEFGIHSKSIDRTMMVKLREALEREFNFPKK